MPPQEAFHSTLKDEDITDEQYECCERIWEECGMTYFREVVIWYNNLNVIPFLEALEKMSDLWKDRKIDIFKDGVSVPGLTIVNREEGLEGRQTSKAFALICFRC